MDKSDTTITLPNKPAKDGLIDAEVAALPLDAATDSVVDTCVVGTVVPTSTIPAADGIDAVAVTVTLAADIAMSVAADSANAAPQEAGHAETTAEADTGPDAALDDFDMEDEDLDALLMMSGLESRGDAGNGSAAASRVEVTKKRPNTGGKPVSAKDWRKLNKKVDDQEQTVNRAEQATQGGTGQPIQDQPVQSQSNTTPAQGTSGSQHVHGQSQTSQQQGSSHRGQGQSSGTDAKSQNKVRSPVKGFFTSSAKPKQ